MQPAEKETLRTLGKRYAEIANDECQKKTVDGWKRINSLQKTRPMVMMLQLPWGELDWGQDKIVCKDSPLAIPERNLRKAIYAAEHFPVDEARLPHISIPKIFGNARTVPQINIETIGLSQHFVEQLTTVEEVRELTLPVIETNPEQDQRNLEMVQEVFDGILPVRLRGHVRHTGLWDMITTRISPQRLLYDLIDRPEYVSELIAKVVELEHGILDQMEESGVLDAELEEIHCTGAFTDELPSDKYDGKKAKAKDTWVFSMAQMFSEVSPAMQDEFDIIPLKPLLERYGLVYYGCCEPLHNKIDLIRKISNVRKISISPWADKEIAAEKIHGDYVFSAKPNPAHVAMGSLDVDLIRNDLQETVDICRKHNTPCELILKDVSTVNNDPTRLDKWAEIAMDVVQN
jgi:hypothetical protein